MHDFMLNLLITGQLKASWWQIVLYTLVMTHITIAAVTIFLHRAQAHRALTLHWLPARFFRFWLWLTTGMVTREWVAIHRKHHAKCERSDDPHSPVTHGIKTVLLRGSELYRAEAKVEETINRYGHNTPDDWVERHVYSRHIYGGIMLMLVIDVLLFGAIGITVFAVQMAWIPVTAAGIINGLGHWWGYRNFETRAPDASTNISPWGIVIGGEELHNNHHTYPTSAKLSVRPREFDIGWVYIRGLEMLGLAKVRRTSLPPKVQMNWARFGLEINQAHHLEALRYEVSARLRGWAKEYDQLEPEAARIIRSFLSRFQAIWLRSKLTSDELLAELRGWCHDLSNSGIGRLQQFANELPGWEARR